MDPVSVLVLLASAFLHGHVFRKAVESRFVHPEEKWLSLLPVINFIVAGKRANVPPWTLALALVTGNIVILLLSGGMERGLAFTCALPLLCVCCASLVFWFKYLDDRFLVVSSCSVAGPGAGFAVLAAGYGLALAVSCGMLVQAACMIPLVPAKKDTGASPAEEKREKNKKRKKKK